jgi:MFS family permease
VTRNSTGALRTVLGVRPFRLAATAHALAATAQSLPVVALAVYVYQRTHSPTWVAAATAVRLAPRILFSALGGVVGDGHDRRQVLLAGNLAAAAATGLLALLAGLGAPVPAVVAVAFAAAATTTAAYPAMVASLPRLAGPGQLVAANTVVSTVESAAFIAGPGLGGLVLALFSPTAVFAVAALGFVAAAAAVARTPPWAGPARLSPAELPLRRRLLEGVEVCASEEARALVVVLLATELLYGCTVVLLVLVGDGGGRAGLLNAALAAGALAAVATADPLARGRRPGGVLVVSTLASGLPLVALAATSAPLVTYGLLVGCGLASTVVEVQAKTLLQLVAPDDVMARLFGLLDGLASLAMLAGSALVPVLVARVGLTATLVVVGVELPILALLPLARRRMALA